MPIGCQTFLLSLEGDLLAFGNNSEGQLPQIFKQQPVKVPWNGPQVVQVGMEQLPRAQ